MKVIALDPGGTTGWATFDDKRISRSGEFKDWFRFGQIGPEEHHKPLWTFLELEASQYDYTVVCESFEYRKGLRDNVVLVSLEYIGVVKLFVDEYTFPYGNKPELVMQTAATGKTFWTDDKLKKLDLYNPGWKHANDATRHLLYHLMERTGYRTEVLKRLKA